MLNLSFHLLCVLGGCAAKAFGSHPEGYELEPYYSLTISDRWSTNAVADPGFPVGGGVDLVRGAVDPRGGYVLKILHVKMKESGPVGGGRAPGAPPP